jgi:hypothetical protein
MERFEGNYYNKFIYTDKSSQWYSINIPIFSINKSDTAYINHFNSDYLEILDASFHPPKYDPTLPWFRFKSGKTAKIVLEKQQEEGVNIYAYNIALLNKEHNYKDSILYTTKTSLLYIPIVYLDSSIGKLYPSYINKRITW